MSYILKALKQAQESRSIDGTPVTAASQRLRSMERPRQIPWRWIAAAALIFNGLVLLLLVVVPRFGSQSPTSAPAPVNTAAPAPPPVRAPAVVTQTPVTPTPPSARPSVAPAPRPKAVEPREPKPVEAVRPPGVLTRPAERTVSEPAERPAADRTTSVAPQSPPAPVTAVVTPPPPQLGADAGPELRDALAKFKLEVLVWAADPRDRMVFLSGRKFVEGQSLDGKVVVERINEDNIVLGYQGQRVRVKRP